MNGSTVRVPRFPLGNDSVEAVVDGLEQRLGELLCVPVDVDVGGGLDRLVAEQLLDGLEVPAGRVEDALAGGVAALVHSLTAGRPFGNDPSRPRARYHQLWRPSFWEPLRERLLEEDRDLLRGRTKPKSLWLTMNSPIPQTFIAGEIGSGELRVALDIDTGDRSSNLSLLGELQRHRALIEREAGELDFLEGNVRCRVVRRLPWPGKLLTQADRHEEARAWFHSNMRGLQRGLAAVAPLISPVENDEVEQAGASAAPPDNAL